MTDWKARCAELMATLETHYPAETQGHYFAADLCDVLDRTRAELDQPEQEGVTDEEILRLAAKELGYEFSSKWFLTGKNCPSLETNPYELLSLARALLASTKQ